MKRILVILLLVWNASFAQKENNIWYFGTNAGIDFNSVPPVALTNGAMVTTEGCATVSDASGNLLFYTDGISVWNKNHAVMANGTGLTGNISSTQSALIVKQPGSANLYYVITSHFTLNYSIVDMSLNGGLGDVTTKNVLLTSKGSEKLCGAAHINGMDHWILSHERSSNGFNAFCLTSSGISATPVHSNAGISTAGGPGQMKLSPVGDKVAFGQSGGGNGDTTTYVGDFDAATGKVSGGFGIVTPGFSQDYGLEFSPNGRFLYTGAVSTNDIYQYDLNAGSPAAIVASAVVVGNPARQLASMQLSPDMKKIYICLTNYGYIDAIDNPDVAGVGCSFVHNAVYLGGKTAKLGLPNFITSFFNQPMSPSASFNSSDSAFCDESGKCIDFFDLSTCSPIAWKWYFPGAIPDSSDQQNPTNICYYQPGTYSVTQIVYGSTGSDTLMVPQMIIMGSTPPAPILYYSGDTITCSHASAYQWYFNGAPIPNATDSFYVSTIPGYYNVMITDAIGCRRLGDGVWSEVNGVSGNDVVRIYPNPASNELWVMSYGLWVNSRAMIRINNILGENVYLEQLPDEYGAGTTQNPQHQTKIDVSAFAKGVYFVEVSDGEKVYRAKFVKE